MKPLGWRMKANDYDATDTALERTKLSRSREKQRAVKEMDPMTTRTTDLEKYGSHLDQCASERKTSNDFKGGPCDCGLAEAVERAKEEAERVNRVAEAAERGNRTLRAALEKAMALLSDAPGPDYADEWDAFYDRRWNLAADVTPMLATPTPAEPATAKERRTALFSEWAKFPPLEHGALVSAEPAPKPETERRWTLAEVKAAFEVGKETWHAVRIGGGSGDMAWEHAESDFLAALESGK